MKARVAPGAARSYVQRASRRFREIHATLDGIVKDLFPDAVVAFDYGMPGWRIPRRRRVDRGSVKGTIDPNWAHVYLVERKSGITLHLWNPADFEDSGGGRKN